MKRREFIELAGLGLCSTFFWPRMASGVEHAAIYPPSPHYPADAPYGSGHFGKWISDSFGMPAYQYTCNQITDPKAFLSLDQAWRSPTDHMHQVGNDRLVAVASNYGHVQVRQDEG